MELFFKLSLFQVLFLIGVYFIAVGVFSIQTIYYFSHHNLAGWMYFCVMTLAYIYTVYYCLLNKPYSILVIIFVSILIGFIPYEETWKHALDLILHPTDNLSIIAKKLPLFLGILVDIFFYPMFLFIPFLFIPVLVR